MFKPLLRVHNGPQAVSTRKKKESGFRGVLAPQQEQASAREVSNDVLMDFMPPPGVAFFLPLAPTGQKKARSRLTGL